MSPSKGSRSWGSIPTWWKKIEEELGHNVMLHKEEWQKTLPPFMGFAQERYVPGHQMDNSATQWAAFYTCIANGKRVFVWAYKSGSAKDNGGTCLMVSDHVIDPAHHAEEAELQHMYAEQHMRQKSRCVSRTHRVMHDEPIALQAFIYEVTRGGNENMEQIR